MNDYIKREDAIKIAREYRTNTARMIDDELVVDDAVDMLGDMIDDFENIPSADVVEVVRCKDCTRQCICYHSAEYYCSDGERINE